MAWADFPDGRHSVRLLCQSLERGRLGQAYLFTGERPDLLEGIARELASTINCTGPTGSSIRSGLPASACGVCSSCRRARSNQYPDLHWLRAEMKSRIHSVDQVRELIRVVHLKPAEARVKVGIVVDAERMNSEGANAFLKTLEEPPPQTLLILLSTEPDRLLETIVSRCLRLTFPGTVEPGDAETGWLRRLAGELQDPTPSLLVRYRLLGLLLGRLGELRASAEAEVEERSPARRYRNPDPEWEEKWEAEAKAAVEAGYRRRRNDVLVLLQKWWRDVWLLALGQPGSLLALPSLRAESEALARRLDPERAVANVQILDETQGYLHTNVQEALALEVALLRLNL